MKRTSAYFFSIIILIFSGWAVAGAQDTVYVPLKIKVGMEVSGPVTYFFDKDILSTEATLAVDLNEKTTAMIGAGYVDYRYSQFNYNYTANGIFFRTGMDFNLMGAKKAQGKYYTGIGFHYGLSSFRSEVPSFSVDNYWGPFTTSIPKRSGVAHFVEATPGVRAEIIRNLSIGWNINIRVLLSSGTGSDLRTLYLPGFGDAGKRVGTSLSYFITWNIPYKTKRVIILPPAPEEDEDEAGVGFTP